MRYLSCLFLFSVVACSCEKNPDNLPAPNNVNDTTVVDNPGDSSDIAPWKTYVIKAGDHYSATVNFRPFSYDSLHFRVSFDSSAIYNTAQPQNQADWNKIMGFSDCSSFHQQNSVRVVWRYLPERGLELGEYYYVNGQRSFQTLKTTSIGDTTNFVIYTTDSLYLIQCDEIYTQQKRACAHRAGRYQLFPYFGGDEVAPHDIRIAIQQLFPRP